MSCNSLIYVANTASTSVLANGVIPFPTVVRRRGRDVGQAGSAVAISDCGSNYYLVNVSATFTAPVAGAVALTLQQNGSAVVGGTASTTISTATTEVRSLSFSAIVRTFGGQPNIDALTLVNSGVAITLSNATMSVIKL